MVNTLRERRELAGLTQQELADLAGVSRTMVRLLEGGYQARRKSVASERIESVLAGSTQTAGGQRRAAARRRSAQGSRASGGSAACDRLLHERPVDPESGS